MHPGSPLLNRPSKRIHLLLIAAYVALVPIVFATSWIGSPPSPAPATSPLWAIAGVAAWIGGVAVCLRKLALRGEVDARVELPEPRTFQTFMLIALACFEFPAVLGFVFAMFGQRASGYPLMGLALVGHLLFVLPLTLRYWALVEGAGSE